MVHAYMDLWWQRWHSLQNSGERLQDGTETIGYIFWKKHEIGSRTHTQNLVWIIDLNVKGKTHKALGDHIGTSSPQSRLRFLT